MTLKDLVRTIRPVLVAFPAFGLPIGLAAHYGGFEVWADPVWMVATLPVLAVLVGEIISSLREGELGLDIVAALSMSAGLIFGEELAACVVAMMYAGGQYLENFAEYRARQEMSALLARVPRSALRHHPDGLREVALDDIEPGDVLMIRRGDICPADGTVSSATALVDQSALTGESLPAKLVIGANVMSGSTNVGDAFDLIIVRRAAESTFAGIVRLVEQAQKSKAPMARLADRYALGFLLVTVVIAGLAWFMTGDPIRAVAVLVVATPCPLILAVPVALVSGLSRAARQGVLIKGARVLEAMAHISTIVVDKTGTLTDGRPQLVATDSFGALSEETILHLAASLDQASRHVMAQAIVSAARQQGLALAVPGDVEEVAGEGIIGLVEGRRIVLGGPGFVARHIEQPGSRSQIARNPGSVVIAVGVDGQLAGEIVLADSLRDGTAEFLVGLRRLGVDRIVLATGDQRDIAEAITRDLSFDSVRPELSPDQKVLVVLAERKNGPVMMIGDGINDAPALAAADVGVAMGARGTTASAEAADVVLLVDQLDRILPGIEIARGARAIALQSVYAGIGLSILGMVAAALGYISPVQGAILQEVIDVAVILNALRALRIVPASLRKMRSAAPVPAG